MPDTAASEQLDLRLLERAVDLLEPLLAGLSRINSMPASAYGPTNACSAHDSSRDRLSR